MQSFISFNSLIFKEFSERTAPEKARIIRTLNGPSTAFGKYSWAPSLAIYRKQYLDLQPISFTRRVRPQGGASVNEMTQHTGAPPFPINIQPTAHVSPRSPATQELNYD
jgi:hypothetical protein